MKILLSSHNKNKIRELRMMFAEEAPSLGEIDVLSLDEVGLTEDIEETGTTFAENALLKAKFGAETGYISIADDSGLMVDALGGEPGVYSARYAGEGHNDEDNNQKLLRNLASTPDAQRTARFVSSIACIFPDGRILQTEESCEGVILREKKGNGGFGYDPLFYFPAYDKSFAELTPEEKNAVSHRGKAFRRFIREFSELWENFYVNR